MKTHDSNDKEESKNERGVEQITLLQSYIEDGTRHYISTYIYIKFIKYTL